MKGPVVVRPVYLHKDERILGLIFGTMTGLLIFALTEMQARHSGINVTGEELQKIFADYSASVLTFSDYSQVVNFPQGNKWQRQLLHALKIERLAPRPVVNLGSGFSPSNECPWGTSRASGQAPTPDGS
jgi:hypothetical protein